MDNSNFTFACPHCGQHLQAEPDMVGMELDCPTCGKPLTVPQPIVRSASSVSLPNGAQPPIIQIVSKGVEENPPSSPLITVVEKRKGFSVKNKKWLIPVAGVAILLLAVVSRAARKTDTRDCSYTSERSVHTNSTRSAFDSLTRSEQLAIGKVVYMWAQFWSIQNKISEYARYGNSNEAASAGMAGVVLAAMLPRVDDRGTPDDFRRAWRTFVPLLAASNAGDGLFNIASAGLSNGYQPSLQDIVQLLKANQSLEDMKDEAGIALVNFLGVIQRYGVENVFRVANEVASNVDSGIWSMNDFLRKE